MRGVVIVDTGVANTASVAASLRRIGAEALVTLDAGVVRTAGWVVLPGVGSFGAGMARLREAGLVEPIRDRVVGGEATLCVCLGMQLLCAESEESPGVEGLGVWDVCVRRFGGGVRVPHMGWNDVAPESAGVVEPGAAYFANSYRVEGAAPGWGVAWTEHAGRFVSASWRGRVLACQFHPELSGAWGEALLSRWLSATLNGEVARCCDGA